MEKMLIDENIIKHLDDLHDLVIDNPKEDREFWIGYIAGKLNIITTLLKDKN